WESQGLLDAAYEREPMRGDHQTATEQLGKRRQAREGHSDERFQCRPPLWGWQWHRSCLRVLHARRLFHWQDAEKVRQRHAPWRVTRATCEKGATWTDWTTISSHPSRLSRVTANGFVL